MLAGTFAASELPTDELAEPDGLEDCDEEEDEPHAVRAKQPARRPTVTALTRPGRG
jgi:hypothetical protein